MAPEEIKAKVQAAYTKAFANRSVSIFRTSHIHFMFRDVRLYGREAGVDFINTNFDQIITEAVEMAEAKEPMLEIPVQGFGQAARDGMVEALRNRTGLRVDLNQWNIKLIWAEANPGII